MADDAANATCPDCRRQYEEGALAKVMTAPPVSLCWHCVSDRYERGDMGDEVEVSVSPRMIRRSIFTADALLSSILELKLKESDEE